MNFDVRDTGILNLDNMSVTDAAWRNINVVPAERLKLKLKAYTVQQATALNYQFCFSLC